MSDKPLKILHLFNSYLPQTENWAFRLVKNLPDVEIHVGAHHYLKNNFYEPGFHFIDNYFDGLRNLNRHLNKKNPGEFLQKLFIKAIPFIFGKTENLFANYAKSNKIDLLHAHFADVGWQFLKVAQKTGIPYVISFYGWDYEKLPFTKPEFAGYFNILFQKAHGFICEGTHGAGIIKQLGCPKEKIHIVHLGVQPDEIPVHKRIKKSGELKLVQIASFTEKKGQIHAVKAFAEALKTCPDMHLTFVGGNNGSTAKAEVEKFIAAQRLTQNIKILDPIDFSQLHGFLKDYHVFIHPSCYAADRDCEGGAPIVLLDAQATGMPVIATTHCDIPEEVIHGQTGLLSQEINVNDLTVNIKAFYEMDNDNYQRYAQLARMHIERQYDISRNAEELIKVYQQILKPR